MKSLLTSRCVKIGSLVVLLFATMAGVADASGSCYYKHHRHHGKHYWSYPPVAICSQYNTNTPLLPYVCCQQLDRHGHKIWGNTWVYGGSCHRASASAQPDMGCTASSPVYGSGKPIVANCQFSSSSYYYRHYYK